MPPRTATESTFKLAPPIRVTVDRQGARLAEVGSDGPPFPQTRHNFTEVAPGVFAHRTSEPKNSWNGIWLAVIGGAALWAVILKLVWRVWG